MKTHRVGFRRRDQSSSPRTDGEGPILPRPPSGKDTRRGKIGVGLILIVGVVAFQYLLRPHPRVDNVPPPGIPSPVTITATTDFSFVDTETFESARQAARDRQPPVFAVDDTLPVAGLTLLDDVFSLAATMKVSGTPEGKTIAEALFNRFPELDLTLTDWSTLVQYCTDIPFLNDLKSSLQAVWTRVVPGEREITLIRSSPRGFRIRHSSGRLVDILSSAGVTPLAEARSRARELLYQRLGENTEPAKRRLGISLINTLLKPDMEYDERATQANQTAAAAAVPPPMVEVRSGEKIVEEGRILTPPAVQKWKEWRILAAQRAIAPHVGTTLISLSAVFLITASLRRFHPKHANRNRFTLVVLFLVLMILFSAWILAGLQTRLSQIAGDFTNPYQDLALLLPVASVAMLVTTLLGGRLALILVAISSLLGALVLHGELPLGITYFAAGTAVVYKVIRIRRRRNFYGAAIWASLITGLIHVSLRLRESHTIDVISIWTPDLTYGLFWAACSGFLSAGLALFLLPLLESFLGITTELRLLEFGLRNEMLRKLEESAPGTYQHSIHVGNLAESAAEAIGANSLLCRVASLYHDIGKIEKPHYFSENQSTPSDKRTHAKMTPNLSCLLIRNHVKEGLEIADRLNLPAPIRDVVAQHHGTTLISYFYDKALSDNPGSKIKESDFRYAGPKPQTIESAIVMLADSIEAASRSLSSYGTGEIRLLVRKVINDKFMDNQFDECDLTLKDLHTLGDCFTSCLSSLLHRRISYPSTELALASKREKKTARELERVEAAGISE